MSDATAVVMAVGAALGAWAALPLPRWAAVLLGAVALGWRRPTLLVGAVILGASALGARAEAGLVWVDPPSAETLALPGTDPPGRLAHRGSGGPGPYTVTLVNDPAWTAGSVRGEARLGERRLELWARGPAAMRLAARSSGERVELRGPIRPVPSQVAPRLASRHIAGRMSVTEVGRWTPGDPLSRAANSWRRLIMGGTKNLSDSQRGLFGGFVLGDDRWLPVDEVEDFRAAGLSHVLVVSGQNVVFVLLLAGPLLRRFDLRGQLVLGIGVLVLFGALTRWEPSVLRAVSMGVVVLFAAALGRLVSRLRVLALAVAGLILLDPLLVRSLSFGLSVGACGGIALLGGPIARRLRGPRWLTEAVAMTLAAQVGVAPFILPLFGGMPLASLPANVAAVPASGLLMMWGMAGGTVAGMVGEPWATVIHWPTRALIAWVSGVARVVGNWPLGQVRGGHLIVALVAAGIVVVSGGSRRDVDCGAPKALRSLRGLAVVALAGALVVLPPLQARWPRSLNGTVMVPGARVWREGGASVLVLDGVAGSGGRLISALRQASVDRLDLVVLARSGARHEEALAPVIRRLTPRMVLVPPDTRVADAVAPAGSSVTSVGPLRVAITVVGQRLAVRVVDSS